MRHSPGTPFSTCTPRSSKAMPDPATRSFTVPETSTSPAPAPAVGHPRPDLQAQAAHLLQDRPRTPDGAGRPVEGGQEAVAGGVDLAPPEPRELLADDSVVGVEQVSPPPVAPRGGPLRR